MGDAPVGVSSGRTALRIDAALLALMWIGGVIAYQRLPQRFPIHFDVAGRADGWAERAAEGFVLWMLLPVIATLTSLILRWAPRAARSNPTLWNIPHKKEFLALDSERREPIQAMLAASMAWLMVVARPDRSGTHFDA